MAKKGDSAAMGQFKKIFRLAKRSSILTRKRYYQSCKIFVEYLDKNWGVKNLKNIKGKHLAGFIKARREEGVSDNTIKNDLSAIRWMYNELPTKYELATNEQLKEHFGVELEETSSFMGNRAWTNEEYKGMKDLAIKQGRQDVADVMTLCRNLGLRVAEATCATKTQAREALRLNVYQVKGEAKNGRWRKVPLSDEAREIFERLVKEAEGERLFVAKGEKTHHVINRFEKFIKDNRLSVETDEGRKLRTWKKGENELTFHGLRYAYVQDQMGKKMEKGLSWKQAAQIVTQHVGHNRIDVIKVYEQK